MADNPILATILDKHGDVLIGALGNSLPRTTDASGALRTSIRFTITRFGSGYSFELYLKDYYKAVDEGQKAGTMVAVSDLKKWIIAKRLVIGEKGLMAKTKGSKLTEIGKNQKLLNIFARNVQGKIYRQGTKGTHFYSETVPLWFEEFKKQLPEEIKKSVILNIKAGGK